MACGIMILAALQLFPKENPKYIYACTTGGERYIAELDTYLAAFDAGDKMTLLYALARIDPKRFAVEGGKGALPDDIVIEYSGAKYTLAGTARNILFNLAILAVVLPYPVYLVRRFAAWVAAVLARR
jgi:hypothetical protein